DQRLHPAGDRVTTAAEGVRESRTPSGIIRGRASSSAVVDRALDEPVLVREAGRLGAVRDAELAIDVREVELDRLFRHPQLLADRLVREATREGREDRSLALGEAGGARRALAGIGQADRAVDGSVD